MTEPVDQIPALLEQADTTVKRLDDDIMSRRPSVFEWAGLVQKLATALRRVSADLEEWRSWARFVLTDLPGDADNKAVFASVCEKWDALREEVDVWREQYERAGDRHEAALQRAREEQAHIREEKHGAYSERNQLVALLSKLWPSHLAQHSDDPDWDPEWLTIVCIHAPFGQLSWHIKTSERALFAHLSEGPNDWDGHSTDEKYDRIAAYLTTPQGAEDE